MIIREAVKEDSANITKSLIEFSVSEGTPRQNIIYSKSLKHVRVNFFEVPDFHKVIVNDKDEIVGGLFMDIGKYFYNEDVFLDEKFFFTSPVLTGYVRIKIAITLLKEAVEWATKNKVKDLNLNMKFRSPAMIKFMEKIGFKISQVSYMMEVNNGTMRK